MFLPYQTCMFSLKWSRHYHLLLVLRGREGGQALGVETALNVDMREGAKGILVQGICLGVLNI